jgi:hypothetical protein
MGHSTGVLLVVIFGIRLPEGNYLVKLFCRTATSALSAVVHVVEKAPPASRPPPPLPGALPADSDHQHVCTNRAEPVPLLEVALELGHQGVLDVQDALANLADGVLVVFYRDLVVDWTVAETHGVQGTGRRERLQGAIDRASREARLRVLQRGRDLVGRAVAAQTSNRVPDLLPLPGLAHAGPQRRSSTDSFWHVRRLPALPTAEPPLLQPCVSPRRAWVSILPPPASTSTSSSIRTPPQPGM